MKIAIVDDMPEDSAKLAALVERYLREQALVARVSTYQSGEDFLEDEKALEYSVVFLDIYMGGLTGMEAAHRLRERGAVCPIVFLTTSRTHALESYRVRAFDYLMKPLAYGTLKGTMDLLLASQHREEPYLVVKEGRGPRRVPLAGIDYVDYYNHYTQIHLGEEVVRTYQKFSDFEAQVKPYTMFLTCHRCVMVNMRQVEKIVDGFFLMKSGVYVPINRKHIKELKASYFNYAFGQLEGDGNG